MFRMNITFFFTFHWPSIIEAGNKGNYKTYGLYFFTTYTYNRLFVSNNI